MIKKCDKHVLGTFLMHPEPQLLVHSVLNFPWGQRAADCLLIWRAREKVGRGLHPSPHFLCPEKRHLE